MKIRMKIQLFSTVWLVFILLVVNTGVYFLFVRLTMNAELNRLKIQTENMVEAVKSNPDSPYSPADLLRPILPANGMIRIINERAEALLIVTKRMDLTELPISYKEGQAIYTLRHHAGERIGISQHPLIWSDGTVVNLEVSESLSTLQENARRLGFVLLLSSLVILLPVFLGSRVVSRLILRPIQTTIATMEDIQRGGVLKEIKLKQTSKDELAQMVNTFNRMITLLKRNFEKQQQFVADASHELRTPLTIIASYANLLKRWGTKKPEVLEEGLDAIYLETERMKGLTEQMLRLAQNDEELVKEIQLKRIHLVQLCKDVSNLLENTYQREFKVVTSEREVYAIADEAKLKQILFILLDNALKYSDQTIVIQIEKAADRALLTIEDKGVGIPRKELAHVFERFYRVDKARQRATGGSGLGLSIAQKLIHAQRGEISIESEEGKGTRVTLTLRTSEA